MGVRIREEKPIYNTYQSPPHKSSMCMCTCWRICYTHTHTYTQCWMNWEKFSSVCYFIPIRFVWHVYSSLDCPCLNGLHRGCFNVNQEICHIYSIQIVQIFLIRRKKVNYFGTKPLWGKASVWFFFLIRSNDRIQINLSHFTKCFSVRAFSFSSQISVLFEIVAEKWMKSIGPQRNE